MVLAGRRLAELIKDIYGEEQEDAMVYEYDRASTIGSFSIAAGLLLTLLNLY